MNAKKDLLEQLFSLQRFGIKPGLERTEAILNEIDNPHKKIKTIHIAGTNGKGSVCSMLSSILLESGLKIGLFTSPHIHLFNERIKINGRDIEDNDLIELTELLLPISKKYGCTFFEITTAMALEYFYKNKVDIAVIETGMGGRYDSTNVLTPILSIITKIALDHKQYLGNTIEDIAFEKAGIIKTGVPVVLSKNDIQVSKIIEKVAKEKQTEVFYSDKIANINNITNHSDFSMTLDLTFDDNTLERKIFKDIYLPLAGKHQVENFASVVTAYYLMKKTNEIIKSKLSNEDKDFEAVIRNGMFNLKQNSSLRARIERKRTNPLIVIDVAHNPNAISNLVQTLRDCEYNNKWNIIFGVMADKDYDEMLLELNQICKSIIFTQPKVERSLSIEKLTEEAIRLGMNVVYTTESSEKALKFALEQGEPLLITGSFYLVDEILRYLD